MAIESDEPLVAGAGYDEVDPWRDVTVPPWRKNRLPDQIDWPWARIHTPALYAQWRDYGSRLQAAADARATGASPEGQRDVLGWRNSVDQIENLIRHQMQRKGSYRWVDADGRVHVAPPGVGGIVTSESLYAEKQQVCSICGDGSQVLHAGRDGQLVCGFGCMEEVE